MLKTWVLLSSSLQLLSRAGEGKASPPRTNTRSEDPDDSTSCLIIWLLKEQSRVGVTCENKWKNTVIFKVKFYFDSPRPNMSPTCRTVVLLSLNSAVAKRWGIFLTIEGMIRSCAPDDKARKMSTTEGSNVKGEARKTTSSALIWNKDLCKERCCFWCT